MHDPSSARNTGTCDFLVVGGGVVGLASAVALAEDGARVTLVERADGPASASSGAAAGIVSLLYPWEHPEPLQRLGACSRALHARWAATLGADFGWAERGLLSFDAAAAPSAVPRIGAAEIAARAPAVAPPAPHALWLPDVATVAPRRLGAVLADRALALGVVLRWNCAVNAIALAGGGAAGVVLDGGTRIAAGAVVVAAGAWSAVLLEPVCVTVPVRPVRGQLIEMQGPPGLLGCVVMHGHRYVVPRADGRLLVGSTSEEAGFDASVTADAAAMLKRVAATLLPDTAALPVRAQWAGLRPGSPDGMPLIGPVPHVPGLWLNVGHFRNGITLAPGSAALLAALAANRRPPVAAAPFLPKPQRL